MVSPMPVEKREKRGPHLNTLIIVVCGFLSSKCVESVNVSLKSKPLKCLIKLKLFLTSEKLLVPWTIKPHTALFKV